MNFSSIKFTRGDYTMILVVCLLIIIGMTAIYSASYQVETSSIKNNFSKQIIWFLVGLGLMVITILIPMRFINTIAYGLYGCSIIALIMTFFSSHIADVHRWITIGSFQIQPSEFVKISVLLALSKYLSQERRNLENLREIGIAFLIILVPFGLIVKQPDLGTALVIMSLILPLLYWAGLPYYLLFSMIAPFFSLIAAFNYYTFLVVMILIAGVLLFMRKGPRYFLLNMLMNISVGIITPLLWAKMHGYQQHRILTFLGLKVDPQGAGYQVLQSIVAIGSGGFFGKGFLNGTQTQLRFLPAQHTDFIFSVIGEEYGFVGVFFILGLFYFLLNRGIYIASVCRNSFGNLLSIGIVTIIGFHVLVTISMTAGIMPVTGIPLPFISYGGSSLMANMILIGLLINASVRRYKY
jgi:rod shape determining protein RodA